MRKATGTLNKAKKEISLAMMAANNRFAGFGPSTSRAFRKMTGLYGMAWEEMKQESLFDFAPDVKKQETQKKGEMSF